MNSTTFEVKTTSKMTVRLEDVRSVYSGKPNTCMCGCAGTYYYASAHREESSKSRGYEVRDDEVNDKMVRKVFNIIAAEAAAGRDVDNIENHIFTVEIGSRQYTMYLAEPESK